MVRKIFQERLQMALFLLTIDLSDKLKSASSITARASGWFDGDPTILPIPSDAAPEIPRLILKNRDDSLLTTISPARIDLISSKVTPWNEREKALSDYLRPLEGLVSSVKEDLRGAISRIGWVATHLIELESSANRLFLDTWTKHPAFVDLYEGQLRWLNRGEYAGLEVNRVVQIVTSRMTDDPSRDNLLRITIDINTVPEKPLDLDKSTTMSLAQQFSEAATQLFEAVLPKV